MALLAAPAARGSGVSLQLQGDTPPVVVDADRIRSLADVPATRYRVRSAPGRRARTITLSGTRLATVLRAAGIDPAAVPTLEITRDDGSILYLSRHEIDPASGAPPLIYARGRSVGFAAHGEAFATAPGTPLRITVSTTALLSVRVSASDTEVAPGGRVRFEADVEGALPGERLTYEWRFGDGRTAASTKARHRFERRGRYEVVLSVTGDRASGGSSEPVAVRVGAPVRAGQREGGGRSHADGAPASGPVSGAGSGGTAGGEPGGGAEQTAPGGGAAADAPPPDRERSGARGPRSRAPGGRRQERGALAGRVLGAEAPATTAVRAAGGAAAARTGSHGAGPAFGWIAGAGGCALLLALGGAAEWRAGARRRARVLGAGS